MKSRVCWQRGHNDKRLARSSSLKKLLNQFPFCSSRSGTEYRTIGVKWWGMGVYERETIDGSRTAAKNLSIVREGDLIINKIWVRHGSVAIADKDVDGCAWLWRIPNF